MSIFSSDFSKVSKTFAFFIISLAPTDVAKILSFGKTGLGLTINNLLKLKFFKIEIFYCSCARTNIF